MLRKSSLLVALTIHILFLEHDRRPFDGLRRIAKNGQLEPVIDVVLLEVVSRTHEMV
ncbi:hypothetical protein ACFFQF_21430 [Haladaptatus pallidirubidus]|uniref:Uncharacterized protein n=1 Tax=Haladaptatus pallidirubidus TaxID=1008152 RepID=A0AAV3UGL7_9EURY